MRLIFFFFVILSLQVTFAQNKRYYDLLDRTERNELKVRAATAELVNIVDFDNQLYAGMILEQLNQARKKKGRSLFVEDTAFAQVCNVGVKHFASSYFKSKKMTDRVVHYTEFGLRHLQSHHRLFKAYCFYVNLTHLNRFTPFYYHSADETTALKLFKGRRPNTLNPEHPDYETPTPVQPITELELVEGINELLRKKDGSAELFSKSYTHIGISVRLDQYSINRNKIPHAFVMVIIGGKQTQKASDFLPATPDNVDENNPYTILK